MSRRRVALVAALALVGCGGDGDSKTATTTGATSTQAPPALTPEQLAGQHLVFGFSGRTPPRALLARIRRGEAGGVVFFSGNLGTPAQVRALTRSLRRIPRPPGIPPLLLMVDQEGGTVKRLPGAPSRAAPAMRTVAVTRSEGRAAARTLRAAGMNVNLAPVMDVVRPEGALQSEGRGFGFTREAVTRLGVAFTQGLRDGGVVATAKHFPGFGAAPVNTDVAQVKIRVPLRELRAVDEPPFAAAARAGAGMVMLASAIYPALATRPAVLSPRVVQGELRDRLGFKGVTITDDLETPALEPYGDAAQVALAATRAGADLLMYAHTYTRGERAVAALADALRAGTLDRAAFDASTQRILALRGSLAQ